MERNAPCPELSRFRVQRTIAKQRFPLCCLACRCRAAPGVLTHRRFCTRRSNPAWGVGSKPPSSNWGGSVTPKGTQNFSPYRINIFVLCFGRFFRTRNGSAVSWPKFFSPSSSRYIFFFAQEERVSDPLGGPPHHADLTPRPPPFDCHPLRHRLSFSAPPKQACGSAALSELPSGEYYLLARLSTTTGNSEQSLLEG